MNNIKGILLVIASMAGFTLEDTFIKYLSKTVSTGQILFFLGLAGALIFAAMALAKGHNITTRRFWTRITITRASCEAFGALSFVTALALVPLSTVAAVFQTTPLVITMGSALFFKEHVGWRRWTAIVIGFVGVLIIIRPGLNSFNPNALFVLIAVFFIATRDLITRLVPTDVPSTIVASQGFGSLIFTAPIAMIFSATPFVAINAQESYYFIGALIFGVSGYYAIVAAMRIGDASAVTPFRYTRLVFSLIVGVVVFHERPDALTLIGAALIISTGLYTFLRERQNLQKTTG